MVQNILIHGFGGCPKELNFLNDFLRKHGLNSHVITLTGHGGTKKDLHQTSYNDWINSAKAEVAKLAANNNKINLIGFSMGGLICIRLAQMFNVNKLVLINTPIFFWNLPLIAKRVMQDLLSGTRENIKYYFRSSAKISIKSSIDFLKILFTTLPLIKCVRSKTLILQCTEDETVYYRSAFYLKRAIGKRTKLLLFKGGCHLVFVNDIMLREKYSKHIYNFLLE